MTSKSFLEIREYYFCILKVRIGKQVFDEIIKDFDSDSSIYIIMDKYKLLSKMPNHIHIISIINKLRINENLEEIISNEYLLRSLCLLCKFHDELNTDFKLQSESDMIRLILDLFSEYEYLNYSNNDNQLG